ncbi:hypothetical protein GmHk_15G044805 [Glycine max]|nr:hypothetical protein GmHk_15G044805 [Glycine max]
MDCTSKKILPPGCLGRLYEGSTTIHNIPLRNDQVKVGVEEVQDAHDHIPIPTQEDKQGAMGLKKPTVRLNLDVNDLLYLMTLIIPYLFDMLFHLDFVNVCIQDFDDAKEESNKAASKDKHLLQD